MKKLLFTLPLFFSLLSFGQAVVTPGPVNQTTIEQYIAAMINSQLNVFSQDSLAQQIQHDAWWNGAGVLFIDSLTLPLNTSATFFITLKNENQTLKEIGGGDKRVDLKNINGVYKIIKLTDVTAYYSEASLATSGWSITQTGTKAPVIQGQGLAGVPIYWQTFRTYTKPLPL